MLPVLRCRALTPGPRGLWQENRLCPTDLDTSDPQDTLYVVSSRPTRRLGGIKHDSESLIEQIIVNSPELWPRTQWNPLDMEDFRRIDHLIIKSLSLSPFRGANATLLESLIDSLERSYLYDRRTSVLTPDGQFFHIRAQRLFRSLAEVSHQTANVPIGSVLASWFMSRATNIVSADHCLALGQWCYAILRATMQEVDRWECLLAVLQMCPGLPARLVGRGVKADEVARSLQTIERFSVQNAVGTTHEDIVFERPLPADLVFDLGYPSVRRRLFRSRSLDERFCLPLDDPEQRGDSVDIRGRGHTERALRVQGGMARREPHLQLIVGPSSTDRFDRLNDLDMNRLGWGQRFGWQEFDVEDDMLI